MKIICIQHIRTNGKFHIRKNGKFFIYFYIMKKKCEMTSDSQI